MVFYFTATGNSLYVAKQLDAAPISIPQLNRQQSQIYKDDAIGIVCPVYGSEPPFMVQEFLKNSEFDTPYFYIIMTYGCNKGASMKLIGKICEENNIKLSYAHTVKMVDNYLPGFDMNKEKSIDKHIDEQIESILEDIRARRSHVEETNREEMAVYEYSQSFAKQNPNLGWKSITFKADDSCIGCGLCTRVCPAGCISLVDGKAVHSASNCQKCMACIHTCPAKAIRMSVPEVNPEARYRNPYIKIEEIIKSNCQY